MRSRILEFLFIARAIEILRGMAESSDSELDITADFEDRGREDSDDSDLDFDGLEDEGDSIGNSQAGTDDEEEEARWTDHLSDVRISAFTEATGLTFVLPDDPEPIDFFVAFVGDETNRYARQKLSATPAHLAKFRPVTRAELKAFMGINIIMGIVRLPNLALYLVL